MSDLSGGATTTQSRWTNQSHTANPAEADATVQHTVQRNRGKKGQKQNDESSITVATALRTKSSAVLYLDTR